MLNYSSSASSNLPVDLNRLSRLLTVLAEPKRLLIFNLIMEGTRCNCELGDLLNMPPNLISHHLSKLRATGLVNVERDANDARWVYYSVNRAILDELNTDLRQFLDPARIQVTTHPACGPNNAILTPEKLEVHK